MSDVRGRKREKVGEAVSEGGNMNRNATRRCNGNLFVSIACDGPQDPAGLLNNGRIVEMRFHDCKYDLSG